MSRWKITNPDDGTTLTVEGDQPPTQDDASEIFSSRTKTKALTITERDTGARIVSRPEPRPSTTAGGKPLSLPDTALRSTLGEIGEGIGESLTHEGIPIPGLEVKPDDSVAVAVGKEAVNIAKSVPEFMTSAAGPETAIAGMVAPVTTAAAFTGTMLYDLGKQVMDTHKNWNQMTRGQKAAALTGMAGTGAFALLTGSAAVKAIPKPGEFQGPIATGEALKLAAGAAKPVAPMTAAAVEAQAATPTPAPEKIVAAAYQPEPGKTETGSNHPEILQRLGVPGFETPESRNTPQFGFATDKRPFITREEAGPVAEKSGQALKDFEPGEPVHSNEVSSPVEPSKPLSEVENKPPPPVSGEASPESVSPAAAAESAAQPTGEAPPVEPPAITTPTTPKVKGQPKVKPIEVRKGEVGMMLAPSEVVETSSGRTTTPFPKVDTSSSRKAGNTVRRVDQWLMDNAIAEAESRGDEFNARIFRADRDKPPQASKDSAEEYLFGTQPEIPRTFLKPVSSLESLTSKVESGGKLTASEKRQYLKLRGEATGMKEGEAKPEVKAGPGMVGMGGATEGEIVPVGPRGTVPVHGIAERVSDAAAKAGIIAPIEPGKGIGAEESVERGRELLAQGTSPEKAISDFYLNKNAISADSMAVVRAEGERLRKAAYDAYDKFGLNSPEYEAAWEADSDWTKRIKPMQTEWHKIGMAQQGETEIDTGTFHGLRSAHMEDTGKDFTEPQKQEAVEQAEKVSKANEEEMESKKKLADNLSKEEPKATATTAEKVVKKAAKIYIDQGLTDFDEIRHKIAADLGMSVSEVTRELARTQKAKTLSNDAWRKQQAARRLRNEAKRWLTNLEVPGYKRALSFIPKALFGLKVGFHGTVALGTHAPMVAFQPEYWKTYVQNFGKMYRMVASPAYYEHQVQDLLRKPNYITARRAGLVNDPYQYEDYNSPDTAKYFGNLTGMGNRGYSVLKMLRQDMFDQQWGNLPTQAQIPDVAKAIADGVNHATGVVQGKAPRGTNLALFAPRLEASRVMWLAGDPFRAADTFLQWNKASVAEKQFAMNQLKEKAWVLGTMGSLLALNQGFLTATGSKQKINFTDPFSYDWLKFKAAGMDMSYGNAMVTMARFPLRLWVGVKNEGKLNKIIYEDENTAKIIFDYARSQASPFAGLTLDLAFGRDYSQRPLPRAGFGLLPGRKNMPKRLRAQGAKPYLWSEFWSQQLTPIPVQEGLKEVWGRSMKMDESDQKRMIKAIATISFMSATGARLTDDIQPKDKGIYFPPDSTNSVPTK